MRNNEIAPGDRVRVLTAGGEWHETVALSGCRVDMENAIDRQQAWLSVRVKSAAYPDGVNWPAHAVERIVG